MELAQQVDLTEAYYNYYELRDIAKDHYCAVCGGILNVAYGQYRPGMFGYFIRCANRDHKGVTRVDPDYEKKKRGYFSMESTALSKLTDQQMIKRVDMARFPQDLTPAQKNMIARVAIEYGLDPLMGELMIYQGNPYIRIDGRRRKAQESGELDGIATRPATKDEREAREVQDGDYLYKAEVRRKGAAFAFEGWGKVTKAEIERAKAQAAARSNDPWYLPLVKDPGDIAEKRAEAEALKRAFHLPLPSFEELIGGAAPAGSARPGPDPELNAPAVNAAATCINAPPGPAPAIKAIKRDLAGLKDNYDLLRACHEDFNLQPKDVLAELNVNSVKDLTKPPAEYYQAIAAVRQDKG